MKLTPDEVRRYFESRLPQQRWGHGREASARCPWHPDRTASMSVNMETGSWFCHACRIGGGVVEFEVKFSGADLTTALATVRELTGTQTALRGSGKLEATYPYRDPAGRLAYEKLRYEGKKFVVRQPEGRGGWRYNRQGLKPLLYQLPDVVVARVAMICEGEKDADNLSAALRAKGLYGLTAVTTAPDGAGKWQPEFSPYFAGKRVVLLPDNDEAGHRHARLVAESVRPYALDIKVLELPGLGAKGDVSDFLAAHSVDDLIEVIKAAPHWQPASPPDPMLIPIADFMTAEQTEIDWLVRGIVPRGANGFWVGDPKASKSLSALDMAISLALGKPWLEFQVPRRVRVGIVSREDFHGTTRRRLERLAAAKGSIEDCQDWLYISTRQQRPTWMLDSDEDLAVLIADLQRFGCEFLILDVFRRLHSAEENDNTEMQAILDRLSRVQAETGCSLGLVHHTNKSDGYIFKHMRGASAIHGWMEWGVGIAVVNPEKPQAEWVRRMQFELKEDQAQDPVHYRITGGYPEPLRLELTNEPEGEEAAAPVRMKRR